MAAEPPGPLVGVGRAADVYAAGPGRVLRRARFSGYDSEPEARIMRYLAGHGFPVPEVYEAEGPDLVMEHLDGHDMLADLSKKPWLARRHGRTLAAMHNRLHEILAPGDLRRRLADGDRVMHLDLHPGNIMLTSRGPVVIDWANATAGPGGADVAMAYLILASSDTDGLPAALRPLVGMLRDQLISQYLAAARDDPWPYMERVARARLTDRNVRPAEAVRLQQLADAARQRAG